MLALKNNFVAGVVILALGGLAAQSTRTVAAVTPAHVVRPVAGLTAPSTRSGASLPARPFPQHASYQPGCILPDHISRAVMDDSVRSFYTAWKKKYIRAGCGPGEYYVWFEGGGAHKQCVSEGQGYGMVIVALMAGYDDSARSVYDGLYRYYRSHPSTADPDLMAWAQKSGCRNVDGTSATDGDMDIAYSLLLAHAQWGDHGRAHGTVNGPADGPIDYEEEARRMIAAIAQQEINHPDFTVLLSNSVEYDSKDYSDMRSSDFMPAHFRAFRDASGDRNWDTVIDHNYRLFDYMEKTYSPDAGLVPDFITHIGIPPPGRGPIAAMPARPHYLEDRYDGCYNYNACRMPWRVATDYLLFGDPRAAAITEKINRWIRTTTKDNPDNISAGYSLAGEDLPRRYFEALSFIAPFAVAAMTDRANQQWLDRLWDYIVRFRLKDFDYYDNSIKMIDMIIVSGNYWTPEH